MAGFLDIFRKKVFSSLPGEDRGVSESKDIDDRIALGVLLWVVAEADNKFLPEEEEKIKEILLSYGDIPEKDLPVVLGSIREAAKERIDLFTFTREVCQNLKYESRVKIIENLFRVAWIDKDLDNEELEVIRKISNLFRVDHKDFIKSKEKGHATFCFICNKFFLRNSITLEYLI